MNAKIGHSKNMILSCPFYKTYPFSESVIPEISFQFEHFSKACPRQMDIAEKDQNI